jgi:RNA polymerase sigma factor (sigma-70 family)
VTAAETEDLLRRLAGQVLGAVVRRYGNFDLAEDATQEALLAASQQWPQDGLPDNPRAWLITVASRRLTDLLRSEQARRQREDAVARWAPAERGAPRPDDPPAGDTDDTLVLLLLCCHPSLPAASQIALTLRAVGGLSTAEIARALLGSEQAVTRRITRAKQTIKDSGVPFALPAPGELEGRLNTVLRVLYLIFNEGYASTAGTTLIRADLAQEAIRLARTLHAARRDDSEVAGLLALMLLIHARHRARTAPDGSLIPLAEQDRSLWDRDAIDEGTALVTAALPRGPVGPYQLQAAIAAVHDEAENPKATDWRQIAALYGRLACFTPTPVVQLNRAVAVAMAEGPEQGLELIDGIDGLDRYRHLHSARADLLRRLGRSGEAAEAYGRALELAPQPEERAFLERRLAEVRSSA